MLLTVDFPHLARLYLSPRGTRLALADDESPGEVLVVELPSGKPLARYSGLSRRPAIDFRSESELVIAHGRECWLCDVVKSSHRALELPTERGYPERLYCCRVSPDGKFVALGGWHGGLLLVALGRKKETRLLKLPAQGS